MSDVEQVATLRCPKCKARRHVRESASREEIARSRACPKSCGSMAPMVLVKVETRPREVDRGE